MEKAEIERMLSAMKVPGDFDVAQISWRPDYDSFFYQQVSRRSRRIYLFRGEYIFELANVVVVETPQLGNATDLFTKPKSMDAFLAAYTRVSKDDIRRNRANIGEKLGFLGRIIHGTNPRRWAKELRARIGEAPDFVTKTTAVSKGTEAKGIGQYQGACVQPAKSGSVKKKLGITPHHWAPAAGESEPVRRAGEELTLLLILNSVLCSCKISFQWFTRTDSLDPLSRSV
jgi:hypothetical protein